MVSAIEGRAAITPTSLFSREAQAPRRSLPSSLIRLLSALLPFPHPAS